MIFSKAKGQEDRYLDKAILGDRAGLEYLVDTYRDMAFTIAMRITGNSDDAEEVVQDSFLKAFRNLGNFRRAAKFSTWLYRIVYHTALSKINSLKLDTHPLDEQTEEIAAPPGVDGPWERLVAAERKRIVVQAIDSLKHEERMVITLYYIAEKSISEIMEITGVKQSAIKMRLMRGRMELEKRLVNLLDKK